jgi:serine aminopeptidase S33 family
MDEAWLRHKGRPEPVRNDWGQSSLNSAAECGRPSLFDSIFELRFPMEVMAEATLLWMQGLHHPWPRVGQARRKVVMLIPGFMAGDVTLAPLAGFCRWLGHQTKFFGIRSNSKCPRDTLEDLGRHLQRIHQQNGKRVVLIGQSLGGVYARELGARHPQLVERVITLGSPVRFAMDSSSPMVVALARWLAAVRMKNGCMTESCPCGLSLGGRDMGEIPTTAIYSRSDGVVHWESCVDRTGSRLVENVEVTASHAGMGINADVYRLIADRLALAARSPGKPSSGLRVMREQQRRKRAVGSDK